MDLLIVEDEPDLRKSLTGFFEHHGWNTASAENGEAAFPLLEESPFDVVITDIRMPGAGGMDVLREIKEKHTTTQVILMTGYRDLDAAIDAVNQGAFAYVEKPFKMRDLHRQALEALEEKHRIEAAERERLELASLVGQKEEEISLLRERSEAILGVIPSLLVLVNQEGHIQDVNEPFLQTFKGARKDIIRRPLCEGVLCPQSREGPCPQPCELWNALQEVIASGRPSERFTVTPLFGRLPQETRRTFQVRILPLHSLSSSDATDREFFITMEDITREREMEMQILHSSRLASLGEMASGIAHELSQPLNAISTQSQLLKFKLDRQEDLSEDAYRSAIKEVMDQVFRMSDILQHLRVYGRRQAAAESSEFSPEELLQGSLRLMQSQLKAWGIKLSVKRKKSLLRIRGKLHELQHALTNVLLNARDALREKASQPQATGSQEGNGKEIQVYLRSFLRQGKPWVCIEVRDNGVGMPPSVLERAFDPLFTTKEEGGGSGLGLPIAAKILDEHGGSIRIRSKPQTGTRVRLEIPAQSESESNS